MSAGKRRANVFTSCARGKYPFATWGEAESALLELMDRNVAVGAEWRSVGLVTYKCLHCSRWHIGHSVRGRASAARKRDVQRSVQGLERDRSLRVAMPRGDKRGVTPACGCEPHLTPPQ